MATGASWTLTRFGRLVYGREEKGKAAWKVFESKGKKPTINITILESGYLLVVQGQETLDTVPLLGCTNSLKIQQQSDNLFLRLIVKGESHTMRMQFEGSSRTEAINGCSNAVKKLKEFVPGATHPLHPNQPPAEPPAPTTQACQEKAAGAEPELFPGSLSLKLLTQHYLGETSATLPEGYHHSPLAQDDLKQFLRVCLLDCSFHAFVEKVEVELRKLREE